MQMMKEICELLVIDSHDFPTGTQYKLHMASPTAQGLLNHMAQTLGLLSPQPTHVIGSFPHWGSSQSQLPFTSSVFLAENSFLWNMLLSEFKLVLQAVCLSLWLRTERWKHFSLTLERMTPFITDHQIPSDQFFRCGLPFNCSRVDFPLYGIQMSYRGLPCNHFLFIQPGILSLIKRIRVIFEGYSEFRSLQTML